MHAECAICCVLPSRIIQPLHFDRANTRVYLPENLIEPSPRPFLLSPSNDGDHTNTYQGTTIDTSYYYYCLLYLLPVVIPAAGTSEVDTLRVEEHVFLDVDLLYNNSSCRKQWSVTLSYQVTLVHLLLPADRFTYTCRGGAHKTNKVTDCTDKTPGRYLGQM